VYKVVVGYAGGAKENPTYHDLGGHTEAVKIGYAPEEVAYADLLDIFLQEHDPTSKARSRQYMSLALFADPEQRRVFETARREFEENTGKTLRTETAMLEAFYPAEDYHQKFYLRRYREVAEEFLAVYPDPADFRESTAAARANAVLGGYGGVEFVKGLEGRLGLSEQAYNVLLSVAGRRAPRCSS
jgi:peptide-methionine (S)-S-oxide reductase